MRIEDLQQRPDREVIEGSGASSCRDGAGNEQEVTGRPVAMSEPQQRPAEPSVCDDQPPREQSDDADMAVHSLQHYEGKWRIVDRWRDKESENQKHRKTCSRTDKGTPQDVLQEWTGSTRFRKSWEVPSDNESENHEHMETCSTDIEQMPPPAEDDFSLDVNGGILDLRPTSQQGKRWNLCDRKDEREILWLIRKKRPKLVIGYAKCILFCTVLYHEQIRRGAWFLHDLSGDALQLSLPCMIRLECRPDVFHALGNASDRRDGERVSFLTNSPHIARKVEGANRRENLDSEICDGLRQQVGDAGHASSTMHIASGTQVRPFLT